jgi:hypothetical protein
MTASAYLPDTGNLIWMDFDPTRSRERAGRLWWSLLTRFCGAAGLSSPLATRLLDSGDTRAVTLVLARASVRREDRREFRRPARTDVRSVCKERLRVFRPSIPSSAFDEVRGRLDCANLLRNCSWL